MASDGAKRAAIIEHEDQQRPRDARVPAEQGREGAAGEDREAADDPHRADLVAVHGQRAADAGDHRGGDAGGAEDGGQQVDAGLVERGEGGGRGEGGRGGGALAAVPADRQDADERAGEQDPDGDRADRLLPRATGVPGGEDGGQRGDRRDHRGQRRALRGVLGGLEERDLARAVHARGGHAARRRPGRRRRRAGAAALSRWPSAVCSSGMPGTCGLLGVLACHVDRRRAGGDDEVEHPGRAVDAHRDGRVTAA